MMIIDHRSPGVKAHALRNARAMLRDEPGLWSDDQTLQACHFLMANGTPSDFVEASMVAKTLRPRLEAAAEQEKREGRMMVAWLAVCALVTVWGALFFWWIK